MASGGGGGSPEQEEGEGAETRTRYGTYAPVCGTRQWVPLPSRRWARTQVSGETSSTDSDDGLALGPRTRPRPRTRTTGIANASGTSRGHETAVDSSASPAVLVRATNSTGPIGSQKGKRRRERRERRRRTATTSSPHQDVGEGSDAAEKDTDSSSEYSSPVRRPKSLMVEKTTDSGDVVYVYNSDPVAVDTYHKDFAKYQKKLARLQELPTLKQCNYAANITDWHDVKKKNAVLDVAESVLSISSSHDGKGIRCCSGVIIEWLEVNISAIVVAPSQIICTETSSNDWKDNNVYVPNAKVTAHLLDGTTSELTLLCFSKHYDIAFFELMGGSNLQVTSLKPELEFGSEACVLARDKDLGLICRRTTVRALDPMDHQKNHYLFIGGSIHESCTGGALTDFNRNVLGMVVDALPNIAFIPSSLILGCLTLWQKFKILARPHLGLKLRTVEFLDISHLDQLSRNFKIRCGLIVGKVSSGSYAERNGIRVGDIIFSCQGEIVSSLSQFESILLDVCAKQFEKGNGLNSKVDVELGVFKVRKPARRIITLSVELSDCMEAFN